jgi:hypothetical protein
MRSTRMLTGLMGLALVAAPLVAQSPEARIEAALDRARSANLPVELLESKLAAGQAQNVAMERIAAAIEHQAQAMERAHAALSRAQEGEPSAMDVAVGADAIAAGVSEVVLERIAYAAGAERRTVAIAALAYLADQGIVPEAAAARVEQALERGSEALANLPGAAGGPAGSVPAGGPPAGVGLPGGPPTQAPTTGRPGGF